MTEAPTAPRGFQRGAFLKSIERRPPPDWFPGPPDFVGIGVQKAGTTWWYRVMESHPQIFTRHQQKERQYFGRFGHRGFSHAHAVQYAELFYRPAGGKTGEWTPSYMSDFWVPPLLARAAPQAKLLVLLRNPVARYESGVRHGLHIEKLPLKVAQREAYTRGLYYEQLRLFLNAYPVDQILVLQYERCVAEPMSQVRRTFEFLELDPVGHQPPNVHVSFNESVGPKFVAPQHARESLADLYREDVRQLAETFPYLELDLWPEFA